MGISHVETSNRRRNTQYTQLKTNLTDEVDKQYEFYELDTALVTHVVDNIDDPNLRNGNVGRIGAIKCKPKSSHMTRSDVDDIWAYPLSSNITTLPVVNELVVVGSFGIPERVFYIPINYYNSPNYNGNSEFNTRDFIGGGGTNTNSSDFIPNSRQSRLYPNAGDTILQSRFGSSIRFTDISRGDDDVSSYSPSILISNDLRGSVSEGVFSYRSEDVRLDGSSVYLTSGPTPIHLGNVTEIGSTKTFKTAYEQKTTFRNDDVVSGLNTQNATADFKYSTFKYPTTLNGQQLLLSSDRIVNVSKVGETMFFSQGQFSVSTDSKISFDSRTGVDFSTPNSSFRVRSDTVFMNSPNIFLGKEMDRTQPVVMGDSLMKFLDSFFRDFSMFVSILEKSFASAEKQLVIPGLSSMLSNFSKHVEQYYRINEDKRATLLSNKVFVGPNESWDLNDGVNR